MIIIFSLKFFSIINLLLVYSILKILNYFFFLHKNFYRKINKNKKKKNNSKVEIFLIYLFI